MRSHRPSDSMSKHDHRPIYHHQRDSIDAHLSIVFAALAIGRWIDDRANWSIKKFVRTTRRYRTIEIQAGGHTITAADPLPRRPPPGTRRHPQRQRARVPGLRGQARWLPAVGVQ